MTVDNNLSCPITIVDASKILSQQSIVFLHYTLELGIRSDIRVIRALTLDS